MARTGARPADEIAAPLAFGPVPSRRLGRSLGIGNVPPKSCSYSCVYCQVGRTPAEEIVPRAFWPPDEVVSAVSRRVQGLRERGEPVDALTFVPDGEPTLDRGLGAEIEGLRPLGLRIAVISNGSLLWREEVRSALARADWVSLKVDAVSEAIWRAVNRGHPSLRLDAVLDGMLRFAAEFTGELVTETMLIHDLNDGAASLEATAAFLERLGPRIAYVAVPTRPPAEAWVKPADEEAVDRAYQRFAERLPVVELLTGFEGTAFGSSGDAVADLLGVTAVHPMREDAALALLRRSGADESTLERLVAGGRLERVVYRDHVFYVRRLDGGNTRRSSANS
jgi:wyosine [tRNA(Phe)-imidazoG37] synthetase (radical SAM superfamily)